MANLHKKSNRSFQRESIEELIEIDFGITQLFQILTSSEDYLPDRYIKDDWKAFNRVLIIQNEAQIELGKRIKEQLTDLVFDKRYDILD